MDVNCDDQIFDPNRTIIITESLQLLSLLEPGCWSQLVIGILGVFTNCLLLKVVCRLGWFRRPEFALLINQSIVDYLTAATFSLAALRSLYFHYHQQADTPRQFDCVAFFAPVCVLITCGQRCALIVGIDRLISVLFPYFWVRLKWWYRFSLITLAWTWALVQETVWLAFASRTTCVKVCFAYPSYPQAWWSTVVTVSDTLVSILIVAVYLFMPMTMNALFNRINSQRHLMICLRNMELLQRETLRRVRRLSCLTLASFFCTTFVGFVILDVLGNYCEDLKIVIFVQPLAGTLSLLNTVSPLFLFTWKDKSFRDELIKIVFSKKPI